MGRQLRWAYGVTTHIARRGNLLPQTLASLKDGGFPEPVLFVDGVNHLEALSYEREFGLPVVNRYPLIKTFGNWILGLAELWIRNPVCDRYAMFQDDLVCSKNLRQYLEAVPYPGEKNDLPRGYLNLYTFDYNFNRIPRDQTVRREKLVGWHATDGRGLGAVALVFSREAVWDLLTQRDNIVQRPATPGDRAWRNIDGGIVDAMRKQGWKEYCSHPSLVQHKGVVSVMKSQRHRDAVNFMGEEFDLLSLLKKR